MEDFDPVTNQQVAEFHRRLERNARFFQEAAALIATNHLLHISLAREAGARSRAGVVPRIRRLLARRTDQAGNRWKRAENKESGKLTITIMDANSK